MAVNTSSARDISPNPGELKPGFHTAQKGVFRKEGVYWIVGYGGKAVRLKAVRLKDTKGLGYIAYLLRHPDAEFHVLDLYGGIASPREEDEANQPALNLPRADEDLEKAGIHIAGLGDAGEMLDEQAKAAYRRRLSDLRGELEEAKELGQVERAQQAEDEIDALTRELSRAVGLGGRNRRAASASERARQTITHSIKSVLERIAQSDAQLADILSRCIKTGTFCSYQPDLDFPIAWEFAATTTAPAELSIASGDSASVQASLSQTAPVVLQVSPFSLAERTEFVGRETERASIRAVIDHALNGHGAVVMLEGGPGAGKTRLAMEMAEYASRVGFRYVVGHCYERDEPFPFLPFVEILESGLAQAASLDDLRRRMGDNAAELAQIAPSIRRAFPDIPQPVELPPAQKRRYLFQGLSEGLAYAARTRSYFFVLEDLHWADESTLALLNHLANRVAQLPVVIVGTYRDSYSENNPALTRTLEELIRQGIRPLKLRGLSKDAVAQMLHGLSKREAPESLVSLVFDQTQGNPFFVEELYRHMLEEGKLFDAGGQFRSDIKVEESGVPENVRLIISRRLERLDENEKLVLAAAAVIGRSFSFQLLTEISRIDVDELFTVIEKAQQMGIIVPSAEGPGKPYAFGHELVRQTILAGILAARQERLHADVANAIERLDASAVNERAGEIADHLLKAGSFVDKNRLVSYLTLSGKIALEAAAFEGAWRSFRSALSQLTEADVRERAGLFASLAIAERGLERWEAACANLEEALEMSITLNDRRMIARTCIQLIGVFVWAGRPQEAIRTAHRGLSHFEADESADRARLLAALGQAQGAAGSWEPASEALREALSIASGLSDPKLVARLLGARSTVDYQFFRLREAALNGPKADGAEARPWESAIELQYEYQTLLSLGRLGDAAKVRDELEPLAAKIGQSYSIARCLITRAELEFGKTPDLTKLETVLQQALQPNPKMPSLFWDVFSEVQLSLLDFLRGNWASSLHRAQALQRLEADTFLRGAGVGTLFRKMAYLRDRTGALAVLDEKRAWLPCSGRPNTIGSWWMLALVVEGLVILGEKSEAGHLYPLVRELVDTGAVVLWPIFRFTQTVAGIAASAASQWEAAEDHFHSALQQAESIPHRLEQAEIRRFHAMMLIDRAAPGDRDKAQRLFGEALETYSKIGMPRHIKMTDALLR
jgi:tetratricopeptide (TPR) repeat protein